MYDLSKIIDNIGKKKNVNFQFEFNSFFFEFIIFMLVAMLKILLDRWRFINIFFKYGGVSHRISFKVVCF